MESLYLDAEAAKAVSERPAHVSEDLALRTYTARLLGKNPALVLHGGGNTSVKSRAKTVLGEELDVLHVKGSGWDLATIEPPGHPACRMDALLALAKLPELSDEAMVNGMRLALLDAEAPTPSVEALLHAILPPRFVDHTHADAVLAIVDQPNAEAIARECFGRGLVWVPYVMPGFSLAHACKRAWDETTARGETPSVMVLEKHGIFTFGDTAKESYERMIACVSRAERYAVDHARTQNVALPAREPDRDVDRVLASLRGAFARAAGRYEAGPVLAFRATDTILAFIARKDLASIVRRGSVTPDHVIRTKPWPLVLQKGIGARDTIAKDLDDAIAAYRAEYDAYFARSREARRREVAKLDPSPNVILVPGIGLVTRASTLAAAEIAADVYEHTIDVMAAASEMGRYEPVSELDLFDVEYWSLEQKKLGKPAPQKPLDGKIALVTGAASGIGLATAELFAKEGAHVVMTDRDEGALAAARDRFAKVHGTRIFGVRADVTRDDDVASAVRAAVRRFGGLDVVVSNAGGAAEGRLETAEGAAALERSLELNLLSHGKVARHAAEVMRAQGRGGAFLVNASKSAFAPGPGFGPYSVAKAALVAFVRQLAIDLGPEKIRANAVNADRVRTALFGGGMLESRAKARGLTPDAYMQGNLLGREVTVRHVAEAFVYLARAEATTGAVLAVDGGNAAAFPR